MYEPGLELMRIMKTFLQFKASFLSLYFLGTVVKARQTWTGVSHRVVRDCACW